jgi:trehalose 6-phosphate synthase/phosphatase
MAALFRRVERNSVFRWGSRFAQDLDKAAVTRRYRGYEESQDLPMDELATAFWRARRRLIALDYDGTLVPFARAPLGDAPPQSIHDLLLRLTAAEGNVVALVSGRPRADIEAWFGGIHRLWLSAEHGALLRDPASGAWGSLRPAAATAWKGRVVPVLEHFTDRTPGSFVEEKEYSLVWHYRMADPEFGEWIANELVATLEGMLASTELRASLGKKAVEVRPAWANKGSAIAHVEGSVAPIDFRMAIGDDVTDEDLFEHLPGGTWTIHVGDGPTRARFRLEGPADALSSLERLLAGAPRSVDPLRGALSFGRGFLATERDL